MIFPKMNARLFGTVSVILCLLIVCACSSTPDGKSGSAQELINEGIKATKLHQNVRAKAAFQQVLEDFPDSKERIQALLLLARTYYVDKEFEEAKFHFQKFIELYPAHAQVDRAYYFKAMSDFKQIDLALRDQTSTREALEGFNQLINRFPKSQFLESAKAKQIECEFKLAQNVFEIGKFYYRTGSYQSAIIRLKNLVAEHPKHKHLDEAMFLIAESYYHEQSFDEASVSYKELLKRYPRSRFSIQAKSRLRTLRR